MAPVLPFGFSNNPPMDSHAVSDESRFVSRLGDISKGNGGHMPWNRSNDTSSLGCHCGPL